MRRCTAFSLFAFALFLGFTLPAQATHTHTKRVSPRASCGNAANEYCLDGSDQDVDCGSSSAKVKVCVYDNDQPPAGAAGALENSEFITCNTAVARCHRNCDANNPDAASRKTCNDGCFPENVCND